MNHENKPPKNSVETRVAASAAQPFKSLVKQFSFILIIISVFFFGLELVLALFGVRPIASTEDPLVGFPETYRCLLKQVRLMGQS